MRRHWRKPLAVAAVLAVTVASRPPAREARTLAAGAAQPGPGAIIPLDVTGPRPTAQFTAGDQPPVTVIFDSGAGGCVINTALAKALGLQSHGTVQVGSPGGGNPIAGFLATIPSARLGNAEIKNLTVVAADLPLPLPRIAGVISPNVFAGALVRFELAQARAVVLPKTAATMPTAVSSPYSSGGHPLPAIVIDVAGVGIEAHLDTGSGRGLSMPIAAAKQLELKSPLTPADSVRMVGAVHAAFTAEVAGAVKIGPLTRSDPIVTFVEGIPIANVGFAILKDMILVLDPEKQRSWLLLPE